MSERRRLVLIDDSAIVLAVLTPVLVEAGFEVRAVSSLRQFLNAVLDWKPHLIVTDLFMPGMTGAELCTWLRKQVQTARTPVIICSSAADDELAQVARTVRADGYVSKNAGPEALAAKLHQLCQEIVF
jgi:two-component system, chemotaxis family, response regulator PixH